MAQDQEQIKNDETHNQCQSLRLMCWNINGLAPTQRNMVLKYSSGLKGFLDQFKLQLLCIQEAKVPDDKITKELAVVDGFQSFFACSNIKRGYSGVTTYCSTPWAPIECSLDPLEPISDDTLETQGNSRNVGKEGRVVQTDHGPFVLINVYVPNAPNDEALSFKVKSFLPSLKQHIKKLQKAGREIILCGDFNIAASRQDMHDSLGDVEVRYSNEERQFIEYLLRPVGTDSGDDKDGGGFVDVWRSLHPDTTDVFTCWDEKTSARAFNAGVRIDYVFATQGIASKVTSCEVVGSDEIPQKWSDHAPILVEFQGLEPDLSPSSGRQQPCKEWKELLGRFHDSKQRTLLSMFGGGGASKKKKREDDGGKNDGGGREKERKVT